MLNAMRLLLIGEKIKQFEQLAPGFFHEFGIDSIPIIRMRDFLSHHYEDVDYLTFLETYRIHIPQLSLKIAEILS